MPLAKLIRSVRERINVRIYTSKGRVTAVLRFLRVMVALAMAAMLIWVHGFPQTLIDLPSYQYWIRAALLFFVISFLVRWFFDFEPSKYLKSNAFEAGILSVIILDALLRVSLGKPLIAFLLPDLTLNELAHWRFAISQFLLLLIIFVELGRLSQRLGQLKINPSHLFIASFLLLIGLGTLFLMLPNMTVMQGAMPFMDALFTSVSASCVTGLVVVDTATYFTWKGQLVILILIQLGGLNIISFASFFGAFLKGGIGLKHNLMIRDVMSFDTLSDSRSLVKRIFLFTFFLEAAGAIYIYMTWDSSVVFSSPLSRVFHSVFHSVSAFNNAGFSTFTNGLFEQGVRNSYVMHFGIAGLVFLGGIGVTVLNDLFSPERLRMRMLTPWRRLETSTRLSLYTSLILIFVGAIGFAALESFNAAQYNEGGFLRMNWFEQTITSIFQSMTTRTAGFNSVDISILSVPTLLMFMVLMVIGASSGGTGGGIKTSTFAVVFLSALATIRGKKHVQIYRRTISNELVNKASSIFLFSVSVIFIGVFALTIFEPQIPFLHLLFEQISAVATVGLSTGITGELSSASRIVIILSMFVGRVGVLTVAVAISRRVDTNNYKYREAHVMLG
jgi:trk system potassium uptake protein